MAQPSVKAQKMWKQDLGTSGRDKWHKTAKSWMEKVVFTYAPQSAS